MGAVTKEEFCLVRNEEFIVKSEKFEDNESFVDFHDKNVYQSKREPV